MNIRLISLFHLDPSNRFEILIHIWIIVKIISLLLLFFGLYLESDRLKQVSLFSF